MSGKNTVVFGLYPNETELLEAIAQLKRVGFRATDLSMMLPENLGSKDIGHEKHTKAPEGALAVSVAGALIGAALGWLTNVGVIQLPIAGARALIAAGPMVAILAGIGALGPLGAIIGALLGACRPEYEAKRYQGRIRSGGVLLSVHCDSADWRIRAKNALRDTGAEGVASTVEARADFGQSEKPLPRAQMRPPFAHRTFLTPADCANVTQQAELGEPTPAEVHDGQHQSIV